MARMKNGNCITTIFEGEPTEEVYAQADTEGYVFVSFGGYSAIAETVKDLPDLEIFVNGMKMLNEATQVEERIERSSFPLITVEELEEDVKSLKNDEFFVIEGKTSKATDKWLEEKQIFVMQTENLIVLAKNESVYTCVHHL